VISFFKKANPFSGFTFFCNFVKNGIYALEIEVLEPVMISDVQMICGWLWRFAFTPPGRRADAKQSAPREF